MLFFISKTKLCTETVSLCFPCFLVLARVGYIFVDVFVVITKSTLQLDHALLHSEFAHVTQISDLNHSKLRKKASKLLCSLILPRDTSTLSHLFNCTDPQTFSQNAIQQRKHETTLPAELVSGVTVVSGRVM